MGYRTTVYLSDENREWLNTQPRTLGLSKIVNETLDSMRDKQSEDDKDARD